MRCKVGDLAIIIRAEYGNEGRIVKVVRWVRENEFLGGDEAASFDGWLCTGQLRTMYGNRSTGGVFPDHRLMPIKKPDSEVTDVASLEMVTQ